MRFRGRITDFVLVRQFALMMQSLSKCSSQYVLRITPDKFIFVLSEKDIRANGATAWCEIPKDAYFSDYKMEGVTTEDNEIFMEINTEMVASRLSSLKSATSVMGIKIKLTNRVSPCLSFEIEYPNLVCTHDVPISIITRAHWKDYQQPEIPDFDISIGMPDVKAFRSSLERIKSSSSRMSVKGSTDGTISFSTENYTVVSTVKFSSLRVFTSDEGDDDQENQNTSRPRKSNKARQNETENNGDAPASYSVEVDTKHFMPLIPTDDHRPENFVCSLIDNHMVHLFFIYGEISLQYCIPGVG